MEKISKATVSFSIILLICFFLPWVQVSCGSSQETATGLDLSRQGDGGLWLIPLLAVVLTLCGLRFIRINQVILSLIAMLSGAVSLFLMNQQRAKVSNTASLVSARLTGWFWLGFVSAIGMILAGAFRFARKERSPN